MTDPVRILILDCNRYRALLIERIVSEIVSSSMVARFSSGAEVVRELLATHYDIAILSLEGIERPYDLVQAIRLARQDVKLVVAGLPEMPKRVVTAIEALVDSYSSWGTDPGTPIPAPVYRAIEAACEVSHEVVDEARVIS
ncbi:MAG: hypothetical protein J7J98_00920 [candidate division Zixibacteria bacterium]|nr:hypothetical protein [candidate division Zixibacteria bacterium]